MRSIWIHGWASDRHIWSALPLSSQDHIVTLQQHSANFATYCEDYWQQANVTEPVRVVAWSFGALMALQWLQQHPQLIHRLILLNSTPYFVAQSHWPGIAAHTLINLQQRLDNNTTQTLKAFWWMLAQHETRPRHCLAQLQRYRLNQAWLMQALQWMIDVDLRLVAQHYAHRCDWIMGAQDPLLPVTLHHQLPGQVQVLQTGHCPMFSQPERLWGTLEAMT